MARAGSIPVTVTIPVTLTVSVPVEVRREVTHACPPVGSGLTPCCGRTPFELPRNYRMTLEDTLVTCVGGCDG